jgi:hypothetical protein
MKTGNPDWSSGVTIIPYRNYSFTELFPSVPKVRVETLALLLIRVIPGKNFRLKANYSDKFSWIPCGSGVEYLHLNPTSRTRRRKGKSRIWDRKIWSRVPRDRDPRMTALARPSRNCKRQTRSLVRESAPNQRTRNCLTVIKNLIISPKWVLYSKTDWPTDRRS